MRHLFVILLLALGASGCGPVVSGVQIVNANIAISAAETAGAKRTALYEYTAAREYLQKAREEHSYSDFWASRIYADKALKYAEEARKKAQAASTSEQPIVAPEPPAIETDSTMSEPLNEPVVVPVP